LFVLTPLKHKPIAFLWWGQVLSCIGDELHKVALVWLAANLLGLNTGYLTALQAAAVFGLSVFGSIFADNWNHQKTMIWVDVFRGIVVLALPIASFFGPPRLWILVFVAVIASGLNALFTPALRATVPLIAPEKELLQSTNGLMETTTRFARIIGPGLIGVLSSVIPLVQFFTIDAISFFISAFSLTKVSRSIRVEKDRKFRSKISTKEGLVGGYQALAKHRFMKFLVLTNGIVNPAWYVVFPLGIGLDLYEKMPYNAGALGFVISAYGVGNVASNLILGSYKMSRPEVIALMGRFVMGVGFIGIAMSPSLPFMMLSSCIAATGGPMSDLSFLAILQQDFKNSDIAKIYRLDMAMTYGPLVLLLLATPFLFKVLSIPMVIGLCGLSMILFGAIGAFKFLRGENLEANQL
jgi:DHA3 family macrolide efflux protein-like MFS transporter